MSWFFANPVFKNPGIYIFFYLPKVYERVSPVLEQRTSYRFSSLYYKTVKWKELNAWINERWLKVYLLLFFLQSTPNIYALLTGPVQSRWLDIGQFVSAFIDQDYVEVNKNSKKNETNIQPSWKNRFGQQRTYENLFLRDQRGKSRAVHFARSGSQSGFSSCPLVDSAI